MRIFAVGRCLVVAAAVALFPGCGASRSLPGTPETWAANRIGAPQQAVPSSYSVLYRFVKLSGNTPRAGLLNVKGMLYGTATEGGLYGAGTVFKVSTKAWGKALYAFHGGSDGQQPSASLIDVNGVMYGTTQHGGGSPNCSLGCGTVFTVTTDGTEHVLYQFQGLFDGASPVASLIDVNGTLYGTTSAGGSGFGTVFSVTTGGVEKVLYSFKGGSDGADPVASLINVNGVLYGTTASGGGSAKCDGGCGTIFSVTTDGVEKVLYGFKGGSDGADPVASLINLNGVLYGTTAFGGGSANCGNGCGTVFRFTKDGAEKVLYGFKGTPDGQEPEASLINIGGTLYGTTEYGSWNTVGAVFSVTTTGIENVLYVFGGGMDGQFPDANVIALHGTLYGTTAGNGTLNEGSRGTVFAFTP